MPSERTQRRIDAFLDEADVAASASDWPAVAEKARAVLAMDPDNEDAPALLRAAEANLTAPASPSVSPTTAPAAPAVPESFAAGRYHVRRFLGEGGKKRVFLAHDALLDRDVAFALIKTEGLDEVGRQRIVREAQAMGRLGAHPHVVTIFEIGEEGGAPYVVTELMGGGDVEGLIEQAEGPLALARALEIAKGVARGLVFAHAQGIVHRDLKPGNVWLTAEGVAKIGDFGLAVALDKSRLTAHGLMVGTVSYMPPEQALGGAVTPQSDLYSLGAMLYEMVAGKPPFAGDSPVAVISQHINTPPVAPSWHSEHCPPALEALILNLLAKVPADRPASASDVLTAIEAIDPDAKSASHSDSSANPLDRLARGVFVGRERELERLRGAFDNAFTGRGSVVMLVGEPGIGKTRTTQELETYARMRGAQVYWGRANEQGGAPPLWPWVLAGRAYAAQNPDEVRRAEWGQHAAELQRIFPGLRALFPNLPDPPTVDSEEGQFRLFDAMSGFLRSVSERIPLVVVLDDLHWADRATLQMLAHLARELSRARILVLGTYRDTDLDRRHPLSQALADMNREDLFLRIPLRGLSEADVRDYIGHVTGSEPSRELVRRVFEETEGNPFFLSEVVNLMVQEGTLAGSAVADIAIPEGVREALGRRLDRLSEEANALLTTLAVAGREFDHALVRMLGGHDEQASLLLIEEALRGRVIEEMTAGQYRFTHALMQETLLGELSAARQVLLHGQIAEAFEALYGADDRDHLAALAGHYAESAVLNRDHARAAVRYLRLAAEQSTAALGHDEAARLYERALAIIGQTRDPLGEDEAALWTALALARKSNAEHVAGRVAVDRALALYAERGDAYGRARAFVEFLDGQGPPIFRAERQRIDELISALSEDDSEELCRLLAARAVIGHDADDDAIAVRAEAMAARLGLVEGAYPLPLRLRRAEAHAGQGRFREAAAVWDSWVTLPGGRPWGQMNLRSVNLAFVGDVEAWAASRAEYVTALRRERRPALAANSVSDLASIAWRRGDRPEYERLMAEVAVDLSGIPSPILAAFAYEDTDPVLALRLVPGQDHPGMTARYETHASAVRSAILFATGDERSAREALRRAFLDWDSLVTFERMGVVGYAEDAVIELAEEGLARDVATYMAPFTELRCYCVFAGGLGNPDALRGRLALRFGQVDEAEQHFRTGLEWASRPDVRFVIDQGRCLQGLAEVAERRGDVETARAHLDAAGALFARCGAKRRLDQVLAKKQILKA